jgi:4'-phosphopantetheinyl transferase EntD
VKLGLALYVDCGHSLDALESQLHENERAAASAHDGRRRRHFAIGRLAAHTAIDRLGVSDATVWIRSGTRGAPEVASSARAIGVAIAHSGQLAAACAWMIGVAPWRHIGIDVERARETDVARCRYAFSRSERRLLRDAGGNISRTGLFGWVAKEAGWKAFCLSPSDGPDAVELQTFNPSSGHATLVRRDPTRQSASLRVRLRALTGPDSDYLLAVAVGGRLYPTTVH